MKLKIDEIEIPESNPFQNCELNRHPYADILESIVCNGESSYVMSLDGAWGTGKTTFVRMWQQQMENHGFHTIYFNAWEHDYMTDPLIALMGELYEVSRCDKVKASFTRVVVEAEKIFCGILPSLGKAVVKQYLGEEATDVVTDALNETKGIFQKELDKYKEECKSLSAFRTALASYAESLTPEKPIVFIVDELDRCNPTYAVKALERIKHLFAIPHIVFVLAIDKEQLCNSICGFYGSDNINAVEYLRRFIDVEYCLPNPDYEKFFDSLYKKLGFEDFFMNSSHNSYWVNRQEEELKILPMTLLKNKGLTLRQMEKFMLHLRLSLQTVPENCEAWPEMMAFMLYLNQYEHSLYSEIKNGKKEIQELITDIERVFSNDLYRRNEGFSDYVRRSAVYFTVEFVLAYISTYRNNLDYNCLWEERGDKEMYFKYKTSMPSSDLKEAYNHYSKHVCRIRLNNVINHVELLRKLQNY